MKTWCNLNTSKSQKILNSKSSILEEDKSCISLESIGIQESISNDQHNENISESDSIIEERKSVSKSSELYNSSFALKTKEALFEVGSIYNV